MALYGMKLGLQLYSVREELEKDFYGTLRQIRAFGYEGVEFAGLYGHTPEELRAWCAELELTPVSAHIGLGEYGDDPAILLEQYHRLGCSYIVVPWLEEGARPGDSAFPETVRKINGICSAAATFGMKTLYHNHDYEFQKQDGIAGLDRIYAAIPALESELDTCWVSVAGKEPAAYLRRFSGRAPLVHLKDFVLTGSFPAHLAARLGHTGTGTEHTVTFRPVGLGMQDVPALLSACVDAKSRWVIVEEDEPDSGRSRLACARLSAFFLNERAV